MSDEPESDDKTFDPTPRRLEEARKRGEVAQAPDLVTAAAYAGFLLAALLFGGASMLGLAEALRGLLAEAAPLSEAAFAGSPQPLWGAALSEAGLALLPWVAVPAALAVLCLLAQGSLVVAPERLAPRLQRVSPLAALKQRFGADGLGDFVKGLVKIALYGFLLGHTVWRALPDLLDAAAEAPAVAMLAILGLTLDLVVVIVAVAFVLGAADLLWQRLLFLRRMRMTRREVMDESRDSEGDPHLKQQRRARAVEIAMKGMLAEVPKAAVVVVNPTHYAVALSWDRARGGAPVCVAKGVDDLALAIRRRAEESGVPVRSDPPTARALYATVALGDEVPRAEWRAVAAAIRFAERVRQRKGEA